LDQAAEPPSQPDADGSDLAAWWQEHGPDLQRFARRRLINAEDAEDAVQDALVSAAEQVARGDRPRDERAMLFTLVRRRVVDRVRRDATQRRVLDEYRDVLRTAGPTVRQQVYALARDRWRGRPDEAVERAEYWEHFERCLDEMPALMRQAVVFREIDQMPTAQVCEVLGVTRANLWTLVHRGRLRLRAGLSPVLIGRPADEGKA
jgi:RNA polymerase sigma-70 factor (ECF subfamily)